jgi:hypothetical protein
MSEGGTGVSRWKLRSPKRRIAEGEDVSESRRLEKSDMKRIGGGWRAIDTKTDKGSRRQGKSNTQCFKGCEGWCRRRGQQFYV